MTEFGQKANIKGKAITARAQPKSVAPPPTLTQKARSAARQERKATQRELTKASKATKKDAVVKAPVKEFRKVNGKLTYGVSVPSECFAASTEYVASHGWNVKLDYDGMSVTMSGNVTTMAKNWTGQFITGWLAGSKIK